MLCSYHLVSSKYGVDVFEEVLSGGIYFLAEICHDYICFLSFNFACFSSFCTKKIIFFLVSLHCTCAILEENLFFFFKLVLFCDICIRGLLLDRWPVDSA